MITRKKSSLPPLLFTLLLSGSLGFTESADEVRERQLLKEAEGFFGTGRYDLASRRCEQATKLNPANEAARTALWKMKRADAAQKDRAETKAILPTYPLQRRGTVPGSSQFR